MMRVMMVVVVIKDMTMIKQGDDKETKRMEKNKQTNKNKKQKAYG